MNSKFIVITSILVLSLLLVVSPLAAFASSNSGGGVASGCPSLNGGMQQPKANFLTYSDSSGTISVQTKNEPNNGLIAICVYPTGGATGYSQTVDSSISSLWSTKVSNDHLEWGRITGPDTLPINGATYKIGTVNPNPSIEIVLAHVIGTECGGLGMTCFFGVPVMPISTPSISVPIAPQIGDGCAAQPKTPQIGTAYFTVLSGKNNINVTVVMQSATPGIYRVELKYANGNGGCTPDVAMGHLTVGANGHGELQFIGNTIAGTHEFDVQLFGPADYRSTLTSSITLT
jgi:hypothetical protein